MTKEERDKAIRILQWLHDNYFLFRSTEEDVKYATKLAIQELQKEPCEDVISRQFAEWVAREIFDDMWEYNKDAFAELACRKLAKLGIVRANGDKWELIEPQESEEKI